MRTYQNQTKTTKSKMPGKKLIYSLLISAGVIIIATVITLSIVLGGKPGPVIDVPDPGPGEEVVVPPIETKREFNLPISDFTLGAHASLERVVYSSSMEYFATHNGIDLIAGTGTNVMAISAGTVIKVENTVLDATVITIDHGDGIYSYYKGLDKQADVKAGDIVQGGSILGKIAPVMPYERNEGPHLHLEMTVNGKLVDPAIYLESLGNK